MESQIEAKVAAIISDRELAINKGSADGVEIGMRFDVLAEGIEVLDPESRIPIGKTSAVKAVVKIVRIDDDHVSVGRTFRTVKGLPSVSEVLTRRGLQTIQGTPDRAETLKHDGETLQFDRKISVGDTARQIVDSEGFE